MTIASENLPNVEFPASEKGKTQVIETTTISYIQDKMRLGEDNPYVEKYVLKEEEGQKLEEWRSVAIEVFKDLNCGDLIPAVPNIEDLVFLKFKVQGAESYIEGGSEDTGQKITFAFGSQVDLTSELFRKIFQHELAHIVAKRVVSLDSEGKPEVLQVGFQRTTKTIHVANPLGQASVKYSKAAFLEPIADIFAYFCSVNMGKQVHVLETPYAKETCYILGMLDRMGAENNTRFTDEFAQLFTSFNHRDFDWYQHARDTFQKIIQNKTKTTPEVSLKVANSLLRSINNLEVEDGKDVVHSGFIDKWGYKLSEVSEQGDFFKNYDSMCNHLVRHRAPVKFPEINTILK